MIWEEVVKPVNPGTNASRISIFDTPRFTGIPLLFL